MPCWYYEKRDLRYTPSYKDGIDPETEARYRKEGARFIIDCGTKLGLRYDACSTGVVYFHRFYMFHSFKSFHRYVTSACCLFLAGKVEETPKKCKDIVKTASSMLTTEQFAVFGNDPKEDVMTLERILLQTIKFDLQVEHPYQYLVKFAKYIKGEKDKVNSMIQMAWTFINDSMCTTLSLQWEPDIIAVSLLYLAGRLSKFEITDWVAKQPGEKWWENFVPDSSKELLEDVCHQVLDLYTSEQPSQKPRTISPPITSNHMQQPQQPQQQTAMQNFAPPLPDDSQSQNGFRQSRPATPQEPPQETKPPPMPAPQPQKIPPPLPPTSQPPMDVTVGPPPYKKLAKGETYTTQNPYIATQMYSNSFMSSEGAQSIQTLISSNKPAGKQQSYPQPNVAAAYGQQAAGTYPTGITMSAHQQTYPQDKSQMTYPGGYSANYQASRTQYSAESQGYTHGQYGYEQTYQQTANYSAAHQSHSSTHQTFPTNQPPPGYRQSSHLPSQSYSSGKTVPTSYGSGQQPAQHIGMTQPPYAAPGHQSTSSYTGPSPNQNAYPAVQSKTVYPASNSSDKYTTNQSQNRFMNNQQQQFQPYGHNNSSTQSSYGQHSNQQYGIQHGYQQQPTNYQSHEHAGPQQHGRQQQSRR